MPNCLRVVVAGLLTIAGLAVSCRDIAATDLPQRPNIVFIMADDM